MFNKIKNPKIEILDGSPPTNFPILKGLLAAFIGLAMGLIFGGSTFIQSGGYLNDSFSNGLLLITLPLGFLIFYICKFKYWFLYPILLFWFGDSLSEATSFEWLRAVLSTNPEHPQADFGRRFGTAVMIAIFWFALALLIEGLSKAIAVSKFSKRKMAFYTVVAFLPLIGLAVFLSNGEELQAKRAIAAKSYSKPQIDGVEIKSMSDKANEVSYMDKAGKPITIKGSGPQDVPYPKVETLYVDTHEKSVFGENSCTQAQPVGSNQTKSYEIRKIAEENFEYGYAEFELNRSNPPSPENAYKSFLYCFVVNGDRYLFQRDNYGTNLHIKLYPAEEIIRSILASKQEVK